MRRVTVASIAEPTDAIEHILRSDAPLPTLDYRCGRPRCQPHLAAVAPKLSSLRVET